MSDARTEIELIGLAKEGSRPAFELLYHRHVAAVSRRIANILGPDPAALDLTQDVFARAYERIRSYRGRAPFRHWLMRIASNTAFSYRRQRASEGGAMAKIAAEQRHAPLAIEGRYPNLQLLHRALAGIPQKQAEAVLLVDLEGLTLRELADELGVPLFTAAARVRRGRKRLQRKLQELEAPIRSTAGYCIEVVK